MSPRSPLSPFTGGRGRSEKIPPGVWTQCSHTTWRSPQPAKVLYVADQLQEMARPVGEAPDPWIKSQARLGRCPWLRGGRSQAQFLHSDQLSRRDPRPGSCTCLLPSQVPPLTWSSSYLRAWALGTQCSSVDSGHRGFPGTGAHPAGPPHTVCSVCPSTHVQDAKATVGMVGIVSGSGNIQPPALPQGSDPEKPPVHQRTRGQKKPGTPQRSPSEPGLSYLQPILPPYFSSNKFRF